MKETVAIEEYLIITFAKEIKSGKVKKEFQKKLNKGNPQARRNEKNSGGGLGVYKKMLANLVS